MSAPAELPTEIYTDPKQLEIHVTPQVLRAFPDIFQSFEAVDAVFNADPEAYVKRMEKSVFKHPRKSRLSAFGGHAALSLQGAEHASDEILVRYAPFSDDAPGSDAETALALANNPKPSLSEKTEGSPSGWNEITKSATDAELLSVSGRPMPVLTIYSPIPTSLYFRDERRQIRHGDFTPAGELALEAIDAVQELLHGGRSETQISKVHVSGRSLGASNAVGTAHFLSDDRYEVPTLTVQELIVGPKNVLPDLAKKFTIGGMTGEAAERNPRNVIGTIDEPEIRKQLMMKHGTDPIGMVRGMLRGMAKVTYLQGMTHPERSAVPEQVDQLIDRGVSVLSAYATNSAISRDTESYLPYEVNRVEVRPIKGEKTGHLINEHVGLSALVLAMHIRNASRR